jgi:S-DNA-T family DNA segregation ATPase FtsK/SpoIIIE
MFSTIAAVFSIAWLVLRLAVTVGIPAAIVTRLVIAAVGFARLPRAGKRNYPLALWARFRWRWLTRNLGLSYLDQHRRARPKLTPAGTAATITERPALRRQKLRYPRARFRADEYGILASVRTVPKVGRQQFEDNAQHIADQWRCVRVQVSQPKPGRLIVRGLRLDPLTLPLSIEQAPPGVYGSTSEQPAFDLRALRLYLGLDEWGNHRFVPLAGITGITVGGLPGYGKTAFINSILCQLAPLPVDFILIDGKGGGDYTDWEQRVAVYTGDELPAAAAALEDAHALMRSRFGIVADVTGARNAWHVGPTEAFRLVLTVIDECHTFFDLDAVKGQKEAETQVRTCRAMSAQLVKKGRSVLFLTIFITQKQTSDAIPTAIRDNCGIGFSFAVKTKDAAVAALGESIKEYPSYCPTTLRERPAYIGTCTASLPTGHDPFVRLRVPEVTEAAAAARAAETAAKRLDLSVTPAPVPAADSSAPVAPAAA